MLRQTKASCLGLGSGLDAVLWSRAPLVSVRVSVWVSVGLRWEAVVGGCGGWLWWEAVVGGCGRLRIHVQKEHRRQQRHVAGRCGAASARVGVDGDEELVQRGLHG